jgi:hypothetical protein
VVVGNVVEDRTPEGGWVPGGPALYSARLALGMGHQVTLITRLVPEYDHSVFEGIDLRALPAVGVPRYANRYDEHGDRTQYLLARGGRLDVPAVVASLNLPCDVLIVAPAYHEIDELPPRPARVVGVSLQGLLRDADEDGRVFPHRDPWGQVERFVRPGWFCFFSEEDTEDAPALARQIAAAGARALLTRGYRGATLFSGGREEALEPYPATPVDPTGAGDCFATAFLVRYAETNDLADACRFALAAGALAVEGHGLAGVPGRAAIRALIRKVAA